VSFRLTLVATSLAALASDARRLTAQDSLPLKLPPVTVTRDVGRSPLDLPYAITSVVPDSLAPGQTHMLVEQTLALLPGVTVADRTNPSQDTRISIRGFGARSQFGARSIRILRDGMPLTLPDGQTPIDYLDLESVGQVEVIRGTASALYGNASGGVIDLRSIDAPDVPLSVQGRSWSGSGDLRRYVGLFGGTEGSTTYEGNIGRTTSNGYRAFSQQQLTNAFIHATTAIGKTQIALVGLGLDTPVAQNPGALTLTQVDSAPAMADPLSVQKAARKAVHQVQLGLSARRAILGDGEITGQVYGGTRSLYNPLTFAVVDVDRRQSGAGVRATVPATIGGVVNRFSVGADAQWLNDLRKNWANCNGVLVVNASCPAISVDKGVLQLDQHELVSSVGPYARDEIEVGRLRATAGVRADEVRFQVRDAFLSDGDDSGVETLHAVSPMVGAAARLSPLHSLYANVGSAFETPTTTELGNQADGSAGLNPDLKPQFSTTYEVGAKGLALSRYYRNAGRTRRRGAELSLTTDAGPLSVTAAYAFSHFRFQDFLSGTDQLAGKTIPGIPENQLQAAATWRFSHGYLVAEGLAKSEVFVDDANDAAAPRFTVFNARAGGTAVFGRPWLAPVIGVQNLFDRHYVGSVAVNAAGPSIAATKFYEPAPGRTWFVGLSAATSPW
jgi:iron complex outermembrane receptor protein